MPRPTIVIGVGGTGSWVLSWLKKDLIETYGSMSQIPVRLLLLDTANNIAEVSLPGAGYSEFQALDPFTEVLRLPTKDAGGPAKTREIDADILDKKPGYEHLSDWFCAGHFPASALNLTVGAGQYRQLGRLAFVQGLHMVGSADPIYQKLQTMINEVADGQVDIHITGSFAGGTGSGMFLDVAWLARAIATRARKECFITGFFAMPSTFSPQPPLDQRAKTFAAWRELNRAITVRRKGGNGFKIRWGRQPEMHYEVNGPAYDHVYLVDPVRAGMRLPGKPEESTFPIMAEAISFMLDRIAGEQYIQHIITNLNNRRNQFPLWGRPTFSTLNVRVWKIPIHHQRAVYQHNFAKRYLEVLLDVEAYSHPDAVGNPRTDYRLREQSSGRERINDIFSGTDPEIGNTDFIAMIGTIRNIPATDRHSAITELAREASGLLLRYSQMPNTPDGNTVKQQVDQMVSWEVPSYDDSRDPRDQLRSYHDALYGVNDRGGEIATIYGDFVDDRVRGKLYETLALVQDLHLDVFKGRLRNWAHRELAQPQGLASLIFALKQLRIDLAAAVEFMVKAQQQQPDVITANSNAKTIYDYADEVTQRDNEGILGRIKRILTGDNKKKAVTSWLQAVRDSVDQRRGRRALQRMVETVRAMLDFVENTALLQAHEMEQQLVKADFEDKDKVGLYRNLVSSLQDEIERHQYDEKLTQVVSLLTQTQDVPKVNEDEIADLVSRTRWAIDERMRLTIEIGIDPNQPPIRLSADTRELGQARELLDRILNEVARLYTPALADDANTALRMLRLADLMQQLPACRNTLFDAARAGGAQDIWTLYVRAKGTPQELAPVAEMVNHLGLSKANQEIAVSSENAFKLVVFSARELLLPEHFAEWEACQTAYQNMVLGQPALNLPPNYEHVRCDHLFSAEKAALYFEQQVYDDYDLRRNILPLGQRMLVLSPRIVQMLEFRSRIEDFLKIWLFGWAQVRDVGNDYIWTITVDKMRPQDIASESEDFLSVFSSYGSGQKPGMEDFNYEQAHKDIELKWNEMKRTQQTDLLQRCEFELHACGIMGELRQVIAHHLVPNSHTILNQAIPENEFINARTRNTQSFLERQDLTDTMRSRVEAYAQDSKNSPPLTHLVARDFAILGGGGVRPLISDVEAHRQMVEVLLHFMLKELITDIQAIRRRL